MKNVLITGAGGYVGRLLTEALAADRKEVGAIVATDLRPPAPGAEIDGVVHCAADIRDASIAALITQHSIDTVVHLAAVVTPPKNRDVDLEYSVDVLGTENLVRACIAGGVRKLIYASSGAAYGYHQGNERGLSEDAPLRGNDSFAYAKHKRLVEAMLAEHRRSHPILEQLIVRPGTILGERVKNQITDLFDKPVIIGLRGVDTPFVFIWDRDVVAVLLAGIHGAQTGIYNLAGDGVMTLEAIAAALGKPYLPLPRAGMHAALVALGRFGLTQYGAEQIIFLAHRPVLENHRLHADFEGLPSKTSAEVFEIFRRSREGDRKPTVSRWLRRAVASIGAAR